MYICIYKVFRNKVQENEGSFERELAPDREMIEKGAYLYLVFIGVKTAFNTMLKTKVESTGGIKCEHNT